MMKKLFLLIALLHLSCAPPVAKEKKETEQEETTNGLEDYIEYHRYIREVVNALESDPLFREKLEKANEEDIKSGKIAHDLELVSHHVRTKLDEIKRTELQRLKELMAKKFELSNNDPNSIIDDPNHHHVDHANPHTFEIEDLKRLISKTTEDLAEADRKRREEFKQYELQKEYEKFEKLNHTADEEERKKLEEQFKEMENKHKKHEKLHAPGHKQQLEEVWQEQDHMQQEFNPKTFFMLHDLDSNGLWDQDEVKALFIKELDKMYAESAPEDDLRERVEEMERMRESMFKEMDYNKDGFIDYNEFLHQTKKADFERDPGWQGLDEQRPYTDQELDEYIRQHNMQYQGYHPNDINGQMYPPQGQGYHPQQGHQYPQQGHPPPMHQMPPQGHQMNSQGHQMNPQGHPMNSQGYPMNSQGQPLNSQGQPMNSQGQPLNYQGHPVNSQGQPMNSQGQPMNSQGHPMNSQGQPMDSQGRPMNSQGQMPQYQQQQQAYHPPQEAYNPQQAPNSQQQPHNPQQQQPYHPQQQLHPGQLPQAQIHPQQIKQGNVYPGPNSAEAHPSLNKNEFINEGKRKLQRDPQQLQQEQRQNSKEIHQQAPPQRENIENAPSLKQPQQMDNNNINHN